MENGTNTPFPDIVLNVENSVVRENVNIAYFSVDSARGVYSRLIDRRVI